MMVKKIAFEIGKAVLIVGAIRIGEVMVLNAKHYYQDKKALKEQIRKINKEENDILREQVRSAMNECFEKRYKGIVPFEMGEPKVRIREDGTVFVSVACKEVID